MGIKAVRKAVKSGAKDEFEDGTVIRWTSSGRYTYTAVKTAVGWATTAQSYNSYVDGIVDFEGLLEIMSRSETTNVAVATAWTDVE